MCRDKDSFDIAQSKFEGCNLLLIPDFVTMLIGNNSSMLKEKFEINNEKNSICIAMRTHNQAESFYSPDDILELAGELGNGVDFNTTQIDEYSQVVREYRGEYIKEKISELSKYRIVITDLYHGTILSVIAGANVIVLKSTDHKITSGIEWFKEANLFEKQVFYCENIKDIPKIIERINLNVESKNNPYFYNEYFSRLKDLIHY